MRWWRKRGVCVCVCEWGGGGAGGPKISHTIYFLYLTLKKN